jgi:hypothetical protein
MNVRQRTIAATLSGLAVLMTTGCVSKPPCVHKSFAQNPIAYHHVQVLPIVVTPSARPDKTLTTNEVWQINAGVGSNLVRALCESLQDGGFDVIGQPPVLGCPEDWSRLTESCGGQVDAANNEFMHASRMIWERLQKEKGNLSHYRLTNAIASACVDLLATNLDAVVLMRSKVFIESRMARNTRRGQSAIANTVGIAAAVLVGVGFVSVNQSPSGVENTMAIIDSKTSEILWWNSGRFVSVNLNDTNAVARTVKSMLAQLPAAGKPSRSH